MARFKCEQASENDDRISDADELFDPDGVPIRQTNAAVTRSPADRFRIIGAVDADTRSVQAHPDYANEIVRAGRKVVVIFSPNAVIEHSFVVAKPGPSRRTNNLPGANRSRQS